MIQLYNKGELFIKTPEGDLMIGELQDIKIDSSFNLNSEISRILLNINSQIEDRLKLLIAIKDDCLISEIDWAKVASQCERRINDYNGCYRPGWETFYYKEEPMFSVGPLDIQHDDNNHWLVKVEREFVKWFEMGE
jgi:hypothetical protein